MDFDDYSFVISEPRPRVLRMYDPYWPHDCHEFDLETMTFRYGQQRGCDSEDPDDWTTWIEAPLRIAEGAVERLVTLEEWKKQREDLVDWVERVRSAHDMAPQLAAFSDPNEALIALQKHDQSGPGWSSLREDFCSAVLDYVRHHNVRTS